LCSRRKPTRLHWFCMDIKFLPSCNRSEHARLGVPRLPFLSPKETVVSTKRRSRKTTLSVPTIPKRKKLDQERVLARFAAGLCLSQRHLNPGSKEIIDCPKPGKRRGVCDACYSTFERTAKSLTPEKAKAYVRAMIVRGLILNEQERRRLRETNLLRTLVK
jgi:hypothetical protein